MVIRNYIKQKYGPSEKDSYLSKDVVTKIQPAPTKGWDALSPVAAMEPQYAVVLDNWVPRTGYCEIRGGCNNWVQNIGNSEVSNIQSLMVYRPADSYEQMFAAVDDKIYEVSDYAIPVLGVTGIQSAKFQYINFTPGGGGVSWLLAVNGIDPCLAYSNSVGFYIPIITGVNTEDLINITVFKRRIWFVQKDSTKAWFLDIDAIQGAASEYDLGSYMDLGGYLVASTTWTLDGGQGPDDYLVHVTSKGQYIVFKGTDPTDANAWSYVGTFNMIPPIGYRCFCRYGSDDLVITQQGLIPLSQSLPFDPSAARSSALTNRIQNAMLDAANSYSTYFGWQVVPFPAQGLLIFNIPTLDSVSSVQYVMNTITGAWCSFSGWNASCFEIFNGSLYFGSTTGNVVLAYTGPNDNGQPIASQMATAFNYFDEPGRIKSADMVRPFFVADGNIIPGLTVDSDFKTTGSPTSAVQSIGSSSLWDSAIWDTSVWGGNTIQVTNWLSVNSLGTALSVNMGINLFTNTSGSASNPNVFDEGVFDVMTFDGNGVVTKSGQQIPILRVNAFELLLENGGPI